MINRILIYGRPGAGKTFLAEMLERNLGNKADFWNGDLVRTVANDWDFSVEGRDRQARRILSFTQSSRERGKIAVCDFVCPKNEWRELFRDDQTLFVYCNRTPVRDFADTTAMFESPEPGDFHYHVVDTTDISTIVSNLMSILGIVFDSTKPTGMLLGRYQPWHQGHQALFEKVLAKHGQVAVMIRDMPIDEKNPFSPYEVSTNIQKKLIETGHAGKFTIKVVPNVVDVCYGRDVGWTVSKIDLSPEIQAISATNIRKEMRDKNVQ